MKKPFKETKFGKLLTEKLPEAARIVGDALPDQGVLGIVKNLIDGATIGPEEKKELFAAAKEFELTELKMIMEDRQGARSREVEMSKAGRKDWMMQAVGCFIMLLMGFVVYAIFYTDIKDQAHAHFLAGEILGFGSSLVFYYFGTSKGSSEKDETVRNLSK
jgi:hypothetical protein